jgi:hypothetical protein
MNAATETHSTKRRPHRGSSLSGAVALLAQMRQDHYGKPRMMELGQELSRGTIGQMTARSGDPPLHHRRVLTGSQLDFIVI